MSPPQARGWQVSLFQLAITIGILAAYLVDYAFSGSGAWRWMLGLAFVPGAILGLGMIGHARKPALACRTRRIATRARGLAAHPRHRNVDSEWREIQETPRAGGERGRFADLFAPHVRPALIIGIGLAIFQQVTGINTVIYYAPVIVQSAGISSASGAILATAGIGLVNVLMTIVAMWLIDHVGRRPLLLTGIVGMILSLAVLGFVFRMPTGGALSWLAVITLMVYVAFFAISLGPIFWLLIAEIYPLKVRGMLKESRPARIGSSTFWYRSPFSRCGDLGPSLDLLALWVPRHCRLSSSYYLVPETKGRTLEEIEHSFRHPHAA